MSDLVRKDNPSASAAHRQLIFPEPHLRVVPWPDPVLAEHGHPLRSEYVERFWLPVLGPTVVLLLRRFAVDLKRSPGGIDIPTAQLAAELGLGMKGGQHGPLWRAIERACRFGTATRNGQILSVRLRVTSLSPRQLERLPETLQLAHSQVAMIERSTDAA